MKLTTLPNKTIRKISEEVKLPLSHEDKKIAEELIKYIKMADDPKNKMRPGVGIAAVQLGYLKRMFYVRFTNENDEKVEELLINPILVSESQGYIALAEGEGCLSVEPRDHIDGLVHRKQKIIIKGYSYLQNKEVEILQEGFGAIVFQHELDHLDGHLYIDRINKKEPWKQLEWELVI